LQSHHHQQPQQLQSSRGLSDALRAALPLTFLLIFSALMLLLHLQQPLSWMAVLWVLHALMAEIPEAHLLRLIVCPETAAVAISLKRLTWSSSLQAAFAPCPKLPLLCLQPSCQLCPEPCQLLTQFRVRYAF
jgi:hypothetical protein